MEARPSTIETNLNDFCKTAFYAEHVHDYAEALRIHTEAIIRLTQPSNVPKKSQEERHMLEKQVKFHAGRRDRMRQLVLSNGTMTVVLPTALSAAEDISRSIDGSPCLSMVSYPTLVYATQS